MKASWSPIWHDYRNSWYYKKRSSASV